MPGLPRPHKLLQRDEAAIEWLESMKLPICPALLQDRARAREKNARNLGKEARRKAR